MTQVGKWKELGSDGSGVTKSTSHWGADFSFLDFVLSTRRDWMHCARVSSSLFRCVRIVTGGSGACDDGAYGFLGGWKTNSTVINATFILSCIFKQSRRQ